MGKKIINGTEGCTLDKASRKSLLNILTVSSLLDTNFFVINSPSFLHREFNNCEIKCRKNKKRNLVFNILIDLKHFLQVY